MIERRSGHAFAETVLLLSKAIVDAGNTIFAVIDQRAAAASVGLELRPTTLIIFGNPRGGTGLMNAHPLLALELPLKLLVWEERGEVSVAYVPASEFVMRYEVEDVAQPIEAMDGLLERLSTSVT